MKRKYFFSVCISLVCVVCLLAPVSRANEESPLISIQQSFRAIAKKIYPTVVSITTVQVLQQRGGIYYVPDSDPLFDSFFSEYFGVSKRGSFGFRMPDRELKKVGIGSGVIIDPRGYIMTNFHVIENALENKVTVKLTDGRELEAEVKGSDPRYDVALIKILNEGEYPTAVVGNSNTVEVGDWAVAVGNPYAFAFDSADPTMTVGIVSALNRSLPGWVGMKRSYTNLIQTDAAINIGNSGGPLVNIQGEVIGINVAIVSTTGGSQGLGFAVPTNLCRDVIAEVIEGKEILYSWLGVSVQNMNKDLANYFRYPYNDGVMVIKSIPNSPAKIGGVRDGDIITYVNDRPIKRVEDLIDIVNKARVGEHVVITVYRDEMEHEIDIIMGSRPRELEKHQGVDTLYWRGIKIDNVTYEIARDLNLPNLKGVVISDVQPNSPAERAGLTSGEVILQINSIPVHNIDDYYKVIYDIMGDALVKTFRGFFVVKDSSS